MGDVRAGYTGGVPLRHGGEAGSPAGGGGGGRDGDRAGEADVAQAGRGPNNVSLALRDGSGCGVRCFGVGQVLAFLSTPSIRFRVFNRRGATVLFFHPGHQVIQVAGNSSGRRPPAADSCHAHAYLEENEGQLNASVRSALHPETCWGPCIAIKEILSVHYTIVHTW